MKDTYKDYRDQPDYIGACALMYAICTEEDITVQEALDKFGIDPYTQMQRNDG